MCIGFEWPIGPTRIDIPESDLTIQRSIPGLGALTQIFGTHVQPTPKKRGRSTSGGRAEKGGSEFQGRKTGGGQSEGPKTGGGHFFSFFLWVKKA